MPTIAAAPRGEVQFDDVSFSYKPDAPLIEDMTIDVAPRTDGGDRRTDRRRQDDAGQPADAVLRRQRRRAFAWTAVDIRDLDARRAAAHVRHGAAGHVAVLRHHPREHRLRPRGRERGGDRRGREGGAGGPLHSHAARELRHGHQRGGDQSVAGTEAAADHRARVPRRSGDPDPRRGDQQRRHADRGADSEGDGAS